MDIKRYVSFLVSPKNETSLRLEENNLIDAEGNVYPVVNKIPRFVALENYATSFGYQWNLFQSTQIDSVHHNDISSNRFYKNTGWSDSQLKNKELLEVGSGAGRFTQILLQTGANVFSIDYSNAVEANLGTNGKYDFFLAQASVYELPFKRDFFDFILCFGVIQHTPDVKKTFLSMVKHLKPGGELCIDVYSKNWKTFLHSRFWVRPVTKRMSKTRLLKIIRWYVPKWFPVSTVLLKIPFAGKFLAQLIPISNYSLQYPELSKDQLLEWAVLDTFDMLSPAYDQPQSLATLRKWSSEAGLEILFCGKGDNGYVLKARKPALI